MLNPKQFHINSFVHLGTLEEKHTLEDLQSHGGAPICPYNITTCLNRGLPLLGHKPGSFDDTTSKALSDV